MSTPAIRAIRASAYPCRCLWRLLAVQMTITRPWRRMTLHRSHMGFTLGRTFNGPSLLCSLLVAIGDPTSLEVVRGDLDLDPVAGEDADPVHTHLSGAVGQHLMAVLQLHFEHGVGERLYDNALQHDRIFLWLVQQDLLNTAWGLARVARKTRQPATGQPETLSRYG